MKYEYLEKSFGIIISGFWNTFNVNAKIEIGKMKKYQTKPPNITEKTTLSNSE